MLAKFATAVLLLLTGTCLQGCQAPKLEQLPAYDRAVAMAPRGELRCYAGETVDYSTLPSLVPYAVLTTTTGLGKKYAERSLVSTAGKTLKPDVVIFFDGAPYYAGSVSSASAFPVGAGAMAVGFSSPVYEKPLSAICYRLAPSRIGVRWDESGMVVWLSENAKAGGLLEGDRIISINDSPVELGNKSLRSGHNVRALEVAPGSAVRVIWIRPGTGRMEGRVVSQENPPVHLQIPSLDISDPPMVNTPD